MERIVTLWNDGAEDVAIPPYEVDGDWVDDEFVRAGCGYDTTGEHYDRIADWVAKAGLRVSVIEISEP